MQIQVGPSHDAERFRTRNQLAVAVILAGMLLLTARMLLVQVVRGDRYERYAAIERVRKARAPASRGLIRGRDGAVLARNTESHRLEILPARVEDDARAEALVGTIDELLDLTTTERAGLLAELRRAREAGRHTPLVVRRGLVSTTCPSDSTPMDLIGKAAYRFCPTCGRTYEPVPADRACPADRRKLVATGNGEGLKCPLGHREFHDGGRCPYDDTALRERTHSLRCPTTGQTFNDEVAILRANLFRLPEARIQTEIQREYPYRFLASHVLGYVGRVNRRDLRAFSPDGPPRYGLNDHVGRAGLERSIDALLRGVDGEQLIVRRAGRDEDGSDIAELLAALDPRPTVPGLTAQITLDLQLQRVAKVALAHVHSGAVVALDARDGAVLAMYSKPGYDPNVWSGRLTREAKARIDASPFAPMLNKAVTPFPPASVYKVVATAAALEEGLITPATEIHCPGHYEFGGRRFHCHKRSGHGPLDLVGAVAHSCDIYFYKLGEALGIDRLRTWALRMGFGQTTGIELRERFGRIPSRRWYEEGTGYLPGFALSTAVGQKDVTATPLQVARVYAGIGRGGVLPTVHIVDHYFAGGRKIRPMARPAEIDMGLQPSTVAVLQRALREVVSGEGGTARKSRPDNVTMAGKTGTAEAAQGAPDDAPPEIKRWLLDNHAWFVGYAPEEDPEIVVAVFVEHGGSGGHIAAPVAKRVIDHWFRRSDRDQPGGGDEHNHGDEPEDDPAPAGERREDHADRPYGTMTRPPGWPTDSGARP